MKPVSEIQEEEGMFSIGTFTGIFSTGIVYMYSILSVIKSKVVEWTIMVSVSYCAHKISYLDFVCVCVCVC